MRLIDADALEELFRETIGHIAKRPEIDGALEHLVRASAMAVEMIRDAQTIPAVPLEPLCEWLAGYAEPPKYAMKIIPESGKCLINARAKAWEHHFKSLMECGLMEEGKHDHG